ncbi:hypothetical protein CHARACLAT_025649 [Characodon lateralis]|uniref:Uncharacterized protein n=1 Tax=Characodon lateralis TaxID=208331 RepID=A0ABU7EWU3_9TELE|nr:hypothetical protein [Characodon lateralis]
MDLHHLVHPSSSIQMSEGATLICSNNYVQVLTASCGFSVPEMNMIWGKMFVSTTEVKHLVKMLLKLLNEEHISTKYCRNVYKRLKTSEENRQINLPIIILVLGIRSINSW